jgi:hypothetical protein
MVGQWACCMGSSSLDGSESSIYDSTAHQGIRDSTCRGEEQEVIFTR